MKSFQFGRMRILSMMALAFLVQLGFAQSQYRFQHYGTNDGLDNEFAWGLGQDSLGYIWVVYQGLSRFDGYGFKIYKHNPEDSLRSALDFVPGRPIKDRNNFWIPENKHKPGPETMARYDYKTDGFIKYEIELNDFVYQQLFEKDGSLVWFGTNAKGLFSYNFKTGKTENYLNRGPYSIQGFKDLGPSILMAGDFGLWIFDKTTKLFSRPVHNLRDSTLLYESSIDMILESPHINDGNTWLKMQKGLVKIDSNFRVVQKFDFPDGFSMDQWARDSDGVFWLGSGWSQYAGLFRYDPNDSSLVQLKHDPEDPRSLPNNAINDVLVDSEQNIWVATDVGVSVLRRQDLKFYNEKVTEGTIWANIIYKAKEAEYLILRNAPSHNKKLLMTPILRDQPNSIDLQPILDPIDYFVGFVHQGRNTFWICTGGHGIIGYPINKNTGMIASGPRKILTNDPQNPYTLRAIATWNLWEDPNQDLWISTVLGVDRVRSDIPYGSKGSVTRYERWGAMAEMYPEDDKSFWLRTSTGVIQVHLPVTPDDTARFERVFEFKEYVTALYKATDGTLFLGTFNGLYAAKKEGGQYKLSKDPIFYGRAVNSIQEDQSGRLWIDSSVKLLCHDRQNNITTEFDERDGIDHFHDDWGDRLYHLTNGNMLVVGSYGVSIFDPLTFQLSRKNFSSVLTKLEVNNKLLKGRTLPGDPEFTIPTDISVLNELVLDYQHNDFTIEFSAMEMTAPEKNLYRYKLDGYNKDWIESDYKSRSATYTNLDAATYTFRVKATNHNGAWSERERTLKVIILPPPWKTWWAYTGYGLLVAGLLLVARRTIVQRERLKSNLKVAMVEQEKEHFELEKAKEVDRVKTSFFTNISHEFRTPLTLIKGPVQNIIEQFVGDEKIIDRQKIAGQLKLVQRNADLLLKLINQLLDLARLEAGSLKIEKSEGDINSFINAVASSFSSLASHKNIALQIDLPETRYQGIFDKDKLETILINLINNAIKFTPADGRVSIKAVIESDQLILSVSDTGIGIPEDQQRKIFERFHQVSDAHKEVGTGIGLALVKELVALLGGQIIVKSESGKGSEFRITLPIEIVRVLDGAEPAMHPLQDGVGLKVAKKSQPTERQRETEDSDGQSKPHVLVVEDNNDLRAFIIDSLGNEFHFLEASDGRQGLEIATREVPDLIISDVMMPEMDGITMAGKIKNDIRTSHVPLILLTAKSTEDSKLSGLQTGADDYLTKPFNKNELLLKARNSIAIRSRMREKLRIELMSTAPKVEVLSADEQFLVNVKEGILNRLSDEQLSVESLSEDIGLSRVQLYRKVSALTGLSVNELIRSLRLQKAAQLLGQNWGPVSQVAYEVGFSNLSYFSKVFKEEYGVLPSEYSENGPKANS